MAVSRWMITVMGSIFRVSPRWEGVIRLLKVPVPYLHTKIDYPEFYQQQLCNNVEDVI